MNFLAVAFLFLLCTTSFGAEVRLSQKTYVPLFRDPGEKDLFVGPIFVDREPVTNQEFLDFLKARPKFHKSKVGSLFVDANYLSHWPGDLSFAKGEEKFPATEVSWFLARKFCEAQGKRLPTIAEWEVASDAQNSKLEAQILEWYGRPGTKVREVGKSPANKYGIYDMHGLIWEWVDNYAESIMSGDSRGGSPTDSMFCGGAALKAKDPKRYATFIRFVFRSSLNANYTSANLGFRCVRDIRKGSQ